MIGSLLLISCQKAEDRKIDALENVRVENIHSEKLNSINYELLHNINENNYKQIAEALAKGYSPLMKDINGTPVLSRAIVLKDSNLLKLLLSYMNQINEQYTKLEDPFCVALDIDESLAIKLLEYYEDCAYLENGIRNSFLKLALSRDNINLDLIKALGKRAKPYDFEGLVDFNGYLTVAFAESYAEHLLKMNNLYREKGLSSQNDIKKLVREMLDILKLANKNSVELDPYKAPVESLVFYFFLLFAQDKALMIDFHQQNYINDRALQAEAYTELTKWPIINQFWMSENRNEVYSSLSRRLPQSGLAAIRTLTRQIEEGEKSSIEPVIDLVNKLSIPGLDREQQGPKACLELFRVAFEKRVNIDQSKLNEQSKKLYYAIFLDYAIVETISTIKSMKKDKERILNDAFDLVEKVTVAEDIRGERYKNERLSKLVNVIANHHKERVFKNRINKLADEVKQHFVAALSAKGEKVSKLIGRVP